MGKARRQKRENRKVLQKAMRDTTFRNQLAEAVQRSASKLDPRAPWQWADLLADDYECRDGNPGDQFTLNSIENGLKRIAKEQSEWAGIPMPIDGQTLVVEPTYPFAKGFNGVNEATRRQPGTYVHVCRNEDVDETTRIRNRFWSWSRKAEIAIWEQGGKIVWGITAGPHGFGHVLETLGASDAWSLETEFRALALLRSLVSFRQFRQYLLTGTFLETSKRSHVCYLFRRLRPTVAMNSPKGQMRIMCALCLHPIAYYSDSWAGAMTPTDDVIAHLMLMRGDEAMFWRRANQHPAYRPEAGLS